MQYCHLIAKSFQKFSCFFDEGNAAMPTVIANDVNHSICVAPVTSPLCTELYLMQERRESNMLPQQSADLWVLPTVIAVLLRFLLI